MARETTLTPALSLARKVAKVYWLPCFPFQYLAHLILTPLYELIDRRTGHDLRYHVWQNKRVSIICTYSSGFAGQPSSDARITATARWLLGAISLVVAG